MTAERHSLASPCLIAVTALASSALAAAGTYIWLRRSNPGAVLEPEPPSCSTSPAWRLRAGDHSKNTCTPQRTVPTASPTQAAWPASKSQDSNAQTATQLFSPINAAKRRNPYDPSPRSGSLSWDDYFMAVAWLSAERSKDPNKQVGACIVNTDNVILGIGYNGFPRGCSDHALPWAKASTSGDALETKYPYVVHAEANALLNKNLASVTGARIYVTMFPCNECAKLLIQAGIREVVFHESKELGKTQPPSIPEARTCTTQVDDPFGFSFSTTPSRKSAAQAHACSSSRFDPSFCSASTSILDEAHGRRSSNGSEVVCGTGCCCSACSPTGRMASTTNGGICDADQGATIGIGTYQASAAAATATAAAGSMLGSQPDASYMASTKLLQLAGVTLRQHCLSRPVLLPGVMEAKMPAS